MSNFLSEMPGSHNKYCAAVLQDGRTVRIMGGAGLKLFIKDLDGNQAECYHDSIQHVWTERPMNYKYDEETILKDLSEYITKTYAGHYSVGDDTRDNNNSIRRIKNIIIV